MLISVRKFGEADVLAGFMTLDHGLASGLVKGGISKRQRPYLQAGNGFDLTWTARLESQLGFFRAEPSRTLGSALFDRPERLGLLSCACAILSDALAEGQSQPAVYYALLRLLDDLLYADGIMALKAYSDWEAELLRQLGFALDLSKCAATGTGDDLRYISPRTGRAVCGDAGDPYRDRLLRMPEIWGGGFDGEYTGENISAALRVTGYFLRKNVYDHLNRDLPFIRRSLSC